MRLYVGNLSDAMTEEKITANIEQIYKDDNERGTIQKIETFMNHSGLERARKRQSQDPSLVITKSACVILSSYPGKELAEVGLKLDHYSHNIRKTVRIWNGPTPHF